MANDPQNEARQRALDRIRSARKEASSESDAWAQRILDGDRVALAQAISLVESQRPEDRPDAEALLTRLAPHRVDARRYGVTGVPGVGKSTWIEAAGLALLERGHQVAVLAVDPSSQRTGGSMLGDKTRMGQLSQHPRAYVRPSPTGDTLGGVARATRETLLLCEAAGFDRILIETVGVGQSETAVRGMTDLFLLLMLPGGGDGVQGIKRGILEWADVLLMNKADGPPARIAEAKSSLAAYQGALALLAPPLHGAPPLFGLGSSLDPAQVHDWLDRMEQRLDSATQNGQLLARRQHQESAALDLALDSELRRRASAHPDFAAGWTQLQNEAQRSQTLPFDAVRRLLDRLDWR